MSGCGYPTSTTAYPKAVPQSNRPVCISAQAGASEFPAKIRSGDARYLHYAPYLDYRPLAADEPGVELVLACPECAWISCELEHKAQGHAVAHVVPEHLAEARSRKLDLIAKTESL